MENFHKQKVEPNPIQPKPQNHKSKALQTHTNTHRGKAQMLKRVYSNQQIQPNLIPTQINKSQKHIAAHTHSIKPQKLKRISSNHYFNQYTIQISTKISHLCANSTQPHHKYPKQKTTYCPLHSKDNVYGISSHCLLYGLPLEKRKEKKVLSFDFVTLSLSGL